MEKITVIAPKGKTCPKEASRDLITDAAPVTVPHSMYYIRRLAAGELIECGSAPVGTGSKPALGSGAEAPATQENEIVGAGSKPAQGDPSDQSDKSDRSDKGKKPKA